MHTPRPRRYRSRYRHRRLWWPIDPPFEYSRALEAYRLHYSMRLADFAAFLGLSERRYLALVTTYPALPTPLAHHIARRLKVPPWMIYECYERHPSPWDDAPEVVIEQVEEGPQQYYRYDPDTDTFTPITSRDKVEVAAGPSPPLRLVLIAEVLSQLRQAHRGAADPDYPLVRAEVERWMRGQLGIAPDAAFDSDAWTREVLEIPEAFWYR